MSALATIAFVWPEFVHAADWLRYAVRTFKAQLFEQTYPDGCHTELSNHYQRITALEAQRFLELLDAAGRADLGQDIEPRVTAMWDYFAGVMRPDGRGPLNNDGGLERNGPALRKLGLADASPTRRCLFNPGKSGGPPSAPASRFFPWAGQAIARGEWGDSNAGWARLDLGPHGTDHQHRDTLALELVRGNRVLLADPGRFTYQPGPFRDYFVGPEAHNVLRLNGQGAVDPPLRADRPVPALAEARDGYQCFVGTASFPASPHLGRCSVPWTRALFYAVGRYWLVVDTVLAFGTHELVAGWHLGPECLASVYDGHLVTRNQTGPNLALIPSAEVDWEIELARGQETPFPRGWYSRNYNMKVPSSAAEFQLRIDSPLALGWLMVATPDNDAVAQCDRFALQCRLLTGSRGFEARVFDRDAGSRVETFNLDFGQLRAGSSEASNRVLREPQAAQGLVQPATSGVWSIRSERD